jgi:Holliday junction DNA helicase RuvA
MISSLRGKLTARAPEGIVVETSGVGYGVLVPLSTYYHLPEIGEEVELLIHTQVREESIRLYGFSSSSEQKIFELLISIPDIGPRMAINILSGIPTPELLQAVSSRDGHRLQAIPRVGKKMAERIILELQDKLPALHLDSPSLTPVRKEEETVRSDSVQALVNLGYRKQVAEKVVNEVIKSAPARIKIEEILKRSLKNLVR